MSRKKSTRKNIPTKHPRGVSPNQMDAWLTVASHAIYKEEWDEAQHAIDQAESYATGKNSRLLRLKGQLLINTGMYETAIDTLKSALSLDDKNADSHFFISFAFYRCHHFQEALKHINLALELDPKNPEYIFHKTSILQDSNRKPDALELLLKLLDKEPNISRYWNNAGTLYNSLGKPEKAIECFHKAMEVDRYNPFPFSNYITSLHYHPQKDSEEIFQACKEWKKNQNIKPIYLKKIDNTKNRKLRIGMISDGFRIHPVGQMIIAIIENLPEHTYDFFCYSSNAKVDRITQRFQKKSNYRVTAHLTDDQLTQIIIDDKIDVLIDMAGYNNGSRMRVMAMKPAPIQVKWVGGLINTTGLDTIDYLISDNVETPRNSDELYTEKLIRMPGDYICFEPPSYALEPSQLPAISKGHITFGCFNNPMKINSLLIKQWSKIMLDLPDSQLFLKGSEYDSDELKSKIVDIFKSFGVDSKRIKIEGFSPHNKLLECYHHVDIALDPWPYSGGLTTCEALLMGVPVVTMPGPTFAGRHSATHLVNAGMPELVTHSWEEYRARVIELASDLDSLATIRSHLRTILLQSPVCDADTFAAHLNNALRAIWQRYCEGKQPEALNFNEQGEVIFADETEPMQLQHPEPPPEAEDSNTFKWEFEGKVIAIDHGGQLMNVPVIKQMLDAGTLELIEFDPASNYLKHPLRQHESVHYYPNIALGDGQPAVLYACQASEQSGTLQPVPHKYMLEKLQKDLNVLAELPVGTVALDKVSELPSVDWLVLDDLNDAALILENGKTSLKDTLLIHVKLAFQPTHSRQPNFAEIAHWASRNNFRFYCFSNNHESSPVPQSVVGANRYADELIDAGAIFIPDHKRMEQLDSNRKIKLAFISHSIYSYKGLSYEVLNSVSQSLADKYMQYNTDQIEKQLKPHTPKKGIRVEPTITNFSLPENQKPKQLSIVTDPMDWDIAGKINVVDVGANPIDGTPPYKGLLDRGYINLVGFEPQKEALKKLNTQKGPNENYLPYAVGDGTKKTLYLCQAEGMTSTLEPNFELLNRFQGYPEWAKIKQKLVVDTYRLDDIEEVPPIDWLKIDIQGGELAVFKNAEEKLKNCLVIQTEVNFIPLYKDQPLFAEIDQWMRAHGFMLHTLLEQRIRLFSPMVINNQIHQGINQLTTADAVYVKDFCSLEELNKEDIHKLAFIMQEAYGSHDYVSNLVEKNHIKKIINNPSGVIKQKRHVKDDDSIADDLQRILNDFK